MKTKYGLFKCASALIISVLCGTPALQSAHAADQGDVFMSETAQPMALVATAAGGGSAYQAGQAEQTKLSGLPPEILVIIASFCEDDPAALVLLAQTNKAMNRSINTYISHIFNRILNKGGLLLQQYPMACSVRLALSTRTGELAAPDLARSLPEIGKIIGYLNDRGRISGAYTVAVPDAEQLLMLDDQSTRAICEASWRETGGSIHNKTLREMLQVIPGLPGSEASLEAINDYLSSPATIVFIASLPDGEQLKEIIIKLGEGGWYHIVDKILKSGAAAKCDMRDVVNAHAGWGLTQAAEQILDSQREIDFTDHWPACGSTLQLAMQTKMSAQFIKKLITAKEEIHDEALIEAVYHSYDSIAGDLIKLFKEQGLLDFQCVDHYLDEPSTALIVAARNENIAIVKQLVAAGADVNIPDEFGNTALVMATKNCYLALVECLIKAGAKLDERQSHDEIAEDDNQDWDVYGYTALMIAARYNYTKIFQALIVAGADVNAKPNHDKNYSVLICAVKNNVTTQRPKPGA